MRGKLHTHVTYVRGRPPRENPWGRVLSGCHLGGISMAGSLYKINGL